MGRRFGCGLRWDQRTTVTWGPDTPLDAAIFGERGAHILLLYFFIQSTVYDACQPTILKLLQDLALMTAEALLCHTIALQALHNLHQATPVATLLSQQLSADSTVAQKCLHVIFTTTGYLARQGLPLWGHNDEEGNFRQLVAIRSNDVPEMGPWLSHTNMYTHHMIQDEVLQLYGNDVLRRILSQVKKSQSFAVIVDGR